VPTETSIAKSVVKDAIVILQNSDKDVAATDEDTLLSDQGTTVKENIEDETVENNTIALQQPSLDETQTQNTKESIADGSGGSASLDGVSLSKVAFTEGGHISSVTATYSNPYLQNPPSITSERVVSSAIKIAPSTPMPKALNVSALSDVMEGSDDYLTFALSVRSTLKVKATTLNFSLSGGTAGVDYEAGSMQYSTNGGLTWTSGSQATIADANDINSVQIRVKIIDNDGHDGVNLSSAPTAQSDNQNQGVEGESKLYINGIKYKDYGVTYKDYSRNLTLTVTTDNAEIINSSATGKIIDHDDYLTIQGNAQTDGKHINTGTGDDTLNLSGHLKNHFVANTGAGSDVVNISGQVTDNSSINTEEDDDIVSIKGTIENSEVHTGTGDDAVTIKNSTIKGQGGSKATIDTDEGGDIITVENSVLEKVDIIAGNGENKVTLGQNSTLKDVRVTTGKDVDTINIESDMTGTTNNRNDSIISTYAGNDSVNIKSGVTLTNVAINTGVGEEKIELDGVKFVNSELFTEDDNDEVTISNSTFENATTSGNPAGIGTGRGEDVVTLNSGAEFKQGTYIHTGTGNDTINVNSGAILDKAQINAAEGDDEIHINSGAQIQNGSRITGGEGSDTINVNGGANVSHSVIFGGRGDDAINIKAGANFDNYSEIRGDEGDDRVMIEKGASISTSVIKGGDGEDTLNISETIDVSRVKDFEKLELGGAENNVETTITAKDVLDMTDSDNRLRIDGESGDTLHLKNFTQGNVGSEYTEYNGTTQSVTVEVKNEINVDILP
jgi:putative VCBS protein